LQIHKLIVNSNAAKTIEAKDASQANLRVIVAPILLLALLPIVATTHKQL
jgi:hypothetical protein